MKKAKHPLTPRKPAKWYAPTKAAFIRLEALGAPRKDIFEGWVPAQHWTKVKMREGETLGVVDSYRAFGNGKRIITKAVDRFHEQKATIVDFEMGKNSRDHGHILMPEALAGRHISAEHRRRMADEAAEKRRVAKGGLTDHEIELIWKRPGIASTDERAEQIGIPRSTLYAKLKRSGATPGRRPKHLIEA
jgi:hypothetical protein